MATSCAGAAASLLGSAGGGGAGGMPAAAAKVPPTQPVLRCVGETVPLCRDGRALYTPCCMELMQVHPSLVMQGVCGTGDYYCRQGNCAGGACLGTPVVYDSQPLVAAAQSPPPVRRPPLPVRRPPPPTLKPMGECKARQIQHGCIRSACLQPCMHHVYACMHHAPPTPDTCATPSQWHAERCSRTPTFMGQTCHVAL